MHASTVNLAALSEFRSSTPRILFGDILKDVRTIQSSIEKHGLLNPLIVSKSGDHLMVIDGRKRLAALRRLKFEGRLPRSLVRLPYIIIENKHEELADNPMALLSNSEQYRAVKKLRGRGYEIRDISKHLHCSCNHVNAILKVDMLSDNLKEAFLNDALSLTQVRAFATIPNKDAQDSLLVTLGPAAKETDILQAISRGETILSIDEDNVIILPSRQHVHIEMNHAA